jgi:hypothetical protein
MMKNYIVNGLQFQFEEGDQPAGAVEVEKLKQPEKAEEPETKEAPKPANKARKAATK